MSSNPLNTVIAVPQDTIDQIYFTGEYSFTAVDVISTTTFFNLPRGFLPNSLVRAIFSYDNGVSWQDVGVFGGSTPAPSIVARSNISIPTVATLDPNDQSNIITFYYTPLALVNGGSPYTVRIKVSVSVNPLLKSINTTAPRFSGLTAYASNNQYLRIAVQGVFNAPSAQGTVTIPHNLGIIPYVELYLDDATSIYALPSQISSSTTLNSYYVDQTNLYIVYDGYIGLRMFYKVYNKG